MTSKRKLTDAEYAEMADDYEANPPTADEVLSVEIDPAVLRIGRPPAGEKPGKTPALTVRLPLKVRVTLKIHAEAEGATESELVRRAVVEYIDNHPVGFRK